MRTVKWIGLVLVGLLLAAVVWGLVEPYTIWVEEADVRLDHLPPAWEGRRVAVVSDFQIGMWLDNTATVEEAARQVAEMDPALVLILGDFIYHGGKTPSRRIDRVVELMEPLTATDIPIYAVLGNHDYSTVGYESPEVDEERARHLEAALEAAGVRVLQNETVKAELRGEEDGGESLHIVGIGSRMADKARPKAALRGVPDGAARLVMMHNPGSFPDVPADAAPLAVAGHTHGGQIRIQFTPEWSWVTYFKEDIIHADGWARGYGQPGNRLYVNRGIGFSVVPLRINCAPEITLFTLMGRAE